MIQNRIILPFLSLELAKKFARQSTKQDLL